MEAETLTLRRNPSINLLFVWTRSWTGKQWLYIEIYQSTSSLYELGAGRGNSGSTVHRILSINLLFVWTRRWKGRQWPYIEIHQSTSSLYGLGAWRWDSGPKRSSSINLHLYGLGAGWGDDGPAALLHLHGSGPGLHQRLRRWSLQGCRSVTLLEDFFRPLSSVFLYSCFWNT